MNEETTKFYNKLLRLSAVLVVAIILFLGGNLLYKFQSLPENSPREISVSGEGKVLLKPDVAVIKLGANTQGDNSQTVVEDNNKIVNSAIESLEDLGISKEDIKTTSYNLSPVYDYTESGRVFNGYSLNQQIQVKIRDFEKISSVLERASLSGVNTIGSLRFEIDDAETGRAEARGKAIEDAKEKAMVLAEQSGLNLGELLNIYETSGNYPIPQVAYGLGGAGDLRETFAAPTIEPGQTEVSVNVNLVYRIK